MNVDEEIYRAAKAQAELERRSMSEVLNALLRRGLSVPPGSTRVELPTNGFPAIVGGEPLTSEEVRRVELEDDERGPQLPR